MLASEFKFYFFIFYLSFSFLFGSFVKIFSQSIDDSVIVMSMFFPKLTELFWGRFHYLNFSLSYFQTTINNFLKIFFIKVLLVYNKVALSFVKSNIRRMNIVSLQQCFLNISEGDSLLFLNR